MLHTPPLQLVWTLEEDYTEGSKVYLRFEAVPQGATIANPTVVVTSETTQGGCEVGIDSSSSTFGTMIILGLLAGTYSFYVSADNGEGGKIQSETRSITFS